MQVTNLAQPSPGIQAPVGTTTTVNDNTAPLSNTADPAADTLSITSNKIMITRQLITQQIEIALEIKSPTVYTSHADDDAEDKTDQLINKVIQKIHDEKSSNAEDLSDDESHLAAVKSVRVKVAQGFESATLALTHLGVTGNSVANNVEQTRSRIDAAIDQVASQPTGEATDETVAANVETASINTVSAKRELTTSLQLTTRDGDVVTINFSRSQSMTAGSIEGPEGSLVYAGATSSSLIDFSVQGDLSEKESKSISKAVDRINKLAEKLFSGKTGAAMEKLAELKINTKYLAGMSLNMSSSISYQAVSAYAQVSRLPGESPAITQDSTQSSAIASPVASAVSNSTGNSTDNNQAGSAVQLARETVEVVTETAASDAFENPFNEIRNLFAQIANMFTFEQNHITDEHKDFVSELFKDIVDKLEENHGDDHDDDSDEDAAINDIAA